jgi:alkylation response protein AidB-like acyl-CoA dehydrogenase
MDFELSEELAELEAQCRRLAESRLRPAARKAEASGEVEEEAREALLGIGVGQLGVCEELGGMGDPLAEVVALEAISYGDAAALLAAHTVGAAAGALDAWAKAGSVDRALGGPDPLRKERVTAMARECVAGRARAAVGFASPMSVAPRSDPKSEEALAGSDRPGEPVAGGDRPGEPVAGGDLPGEPVARAPFVPGRGSLDLFLVVGETTLGCYLAEELVVSEAHAGAFQACGGLQVEVPRPEAGVLVRLDPLDAFLARARARLFAGAMLVGLASAALDHAIAYGRERVVFGTPVLGHQANAFEVAAASTRLEAARMALRAAAWRTASGEEGAAWLASLAYLEAREAALVATDLGVQMLGGHGYMVDEPVEKFWREARTLALLYGGEDSALDDLSSWVLRCPDPLVVP